MDVNGRAMTAQDHQYLLKLRSAYTPQQLQILEQVMKGVGSGDWNFAKWVKDNREAIEQGRVAVEVSRTDRITMRGTSDSEEKKDNI